MDEMRRRRRRRFRFGSTLFAMPLALQVRLQFHPKRSQWREKLKCQLTKNFAIGLPTHGIGGCLSVFLSTTAAAKATLPPTSLPTVCPPARRQIEEDLRGYLDWITQAEDLEIDPTTTPHVAAASAASRKASSAEVKVQEGDGKNGDGSSPPAANGTGSDGDNGSGAVLLP